MRLNFVDTKYFETEFFEGLKLRLNLLRRNLLLIWEDEPALFLSASFHILFSLQSVCKYFSLVTLMLSTMLMGRGRIMSILKSIWPAFLFIHILTTCFCVWSPHVCNSARLSTSEHFRSAFSVGVGQHPLKDGLIAMKVFLFVLLQNVFGLLVYCSALFALQLHCWTGRPKSLFLQLLGSGHSTVLGASHKTARAPPPPSTTHILTYSKIFFQIGKCIWVLGVSHNTAPNLPHQLVLHQGVIFRC